MTTALRTIQELRGVSAGRLVCWVGSGISAPPPTGLPTAQEFLISMMRLDWVRGDRKLPYGPDWGWSEALRGMRFEHLLSVFHTQWRGHPLAALLGQFAEAQPNGYHGRLASLCRMGVLDDIVTTNFDACIERALDLDGVRFNRIVAPGDAYRPGELNVFKIHGAVELQNGKPVDVELGATLDALAQGLAPWRAQILSKITQDATVVFLGYSGSDSYDINPAILALAPFPALWIAHGGGQRQPNLSAEARSLIAGSPWTEPLVCDTAGFLGSDAPADEARSPFTLKPTFDPGGHRDPAVFVGCVLSEIGDWTSARRYYESVASEPWALTLSVVDQLDLQRGHAVSCHELHDLDSALTSFAVAQRLVHTGLGLPDARRGALTIPEDPFARVRTDHALLLYEEQAVVAARLGDADAARSSLDHAWRAWTELDARRDARMLVRSRLLLNQAQVEYAILISTGVLDPATLRENVDRLLESAEIKTSLGDFAGLVAVRASLGMHLLCLDRLHEANRQLFDMCRELRRLATPIRPSYLDDGMAAIGYQVTGRLRLTGGKSLALYVAHRSETKDLLHSALQSSLLADEFADWEAALAALCTDRRISDLGRRLLGELDVTAPAEQPHSPNEQLDRTQEAANLAGAGHVDAAIQIFDEMIARDPDHADAWLHRSSLKHAQGRTDEAIEEVREATAKFPRDARLLCNLGNLLYEQGRALDALEPLRQAILLDPDDALAWNNLGNCAHHLEQYEHAVLCYQRAISLHGGSLPSAEANLTTTLREAARRNAE